mmetsp:Transcript_22389/g.34648  ORF Transcript_22389/g.34648 Transcript_22389/m.34648 type:complete len:166 (+) Transcript_22389:6-503(+)
MLYKTLQQITIWVCHYGIGIVYPLFRSSRITRGKECEENKLKILKYWILFAILSLISYYFDWILSAYLDIGKMSIAALEFILVVADFKFTELIYDNYVCCVFSTNEKLLHSFFQSIRRIIEKTLFSWLSKFCEIVLSLVCGIIPMFPAPIGAALEFIGITSALKS